MARMVNMIYRYDVFKYNFQIPLLKKMEVIAYQIWTLKF